MRIAVTGATGHLGANLVRRLLQSDHQVTVLVRQDLRAVENLNLEQVRGDLLDSRSLEAAFDGAEVVYHLAAHISILPERKKLQQVNVQGTANVVAACLRRKVKRLVYTSSVEALIAQSTGQEIICEQPQPPPRRLKNAYGQSKAQAVDEIHRGLEQGLDAVMVNPSAIIGPCDFKPSHFGQAIVDLARGSMPALVEGGFDLVDARDVADGLMAAASKGKRGENYLLTGRFVELTELATQIEHLTGRRRPRLVLPARLAAFAGRFTPPYYKLTGKRPRFTRMSVSLVAARYRFSNEKARRHLDYAPRPFEITIKDTIDWLRDQGHIAQT